MTTRRPGVSIALLFLLCSLMISAGNCQNLDELMQSYGSAISKSMNESGGDSSDALRSGIALLSHPAKAKCLQKLSPCKEFLHFEGTPPSSCCDPLTDIVNDDNEDCVCIFNSENLLHSVNITQKDALALAGACGVKPDLSNCKNDTANSPSGSPGTTASISLPPISIESSGAGESTADSSSSSSSEDKKETSAASAAATFGGKKSHLSGLALTATALLGLNFKLIC